MYPIRATGTRALKRTGKKLKNRDFLNRFVYRRMRLSARERNTRITGVTKATSAVLHVIFL